MSAVEGGRNRRGCQRKQTFNYKIKKAWDLMVTLDNDTFITEFLPKNVSIREGYELT